MREILFRGKKESTGDWMFGDLRHFRSGKVGIHSDVLRYTLLADPENEDFTPAANSPVFDIGFEPFGLDDVGIIPET